MTCRHCHAHIRLATFRSGRSVWVADVNPPAVPTWFCLPQSLGTTHEPEETHGQG